MVKKKSKKVKKPALADASVQEDVPRSFVFRKGAGSKQVKKLVISLRKVMEPHTAISLKESKSNTLKDYLKYALPLKVTHFLQVSVSNLKNVFLSFLSIPRGPSLIFRVQKYSFLEEVQSVTSGHIITSGSESKYPPLVVMNNFNSKERHSKLIVTMLQNMFPPINVETVKLNECRRVVLYDYHKEDDVIEMRHYLITAIPDDLSKPVKRLVQARIPNLANVNDISDYFLGAANASDSEMSDVEDSKVTLSHNFGSGKPQKEPTRNIVRLKEIGPRLTLSLLKVMDGLLDGNVLYHKYIKKTPLEIEQMRKKQSDREKMKKLMQKRREENMLKKQHRGNKPQQENAKNEKETEEFSSDDDAGYYREQVGEEADDGLKKVRESAEKKREKFNPFTHKKVNKRKRTQEDGNEPKPQTKKFKGTKRKQKK